MVALLRFTLLATFLWHLLGGWGSLALAASLPPPGQVVSTVTHLRPITPLLASVQALSPLHVADTCNTDPTGCATSITQQFGGLYQVGFVLLIWAGVALAGLLLAVSAIRGMVGMGLGEPRVLAETVLKAAGVIACLVIAFQAPNIVNLALHGAGQHIIAPTPPSIGQ